MKTQYQFLHDQLVNSLDQMMAILEKVNASIEKGIVTEQEVLVGQIAPDMLNFTKQVQISTDLVQGSICRLAGIDKPNVQDNEETLSDLIARVEMTKVYVKNIDVNMLQAEGKQIRLGWMPTGAYFDGIDYAEKFILQNTFFHLVTAYAIARSKGVVIGKMDYLTNLSMKQ